MKVWKNTATLDALLPCLGDGVAPEEAQVALLGSKSIDLDSMPNLRGIFKCGVGVDNVPFEDCKRRGIRVGLPSERTADVIYEETASFASALVHRMLYADVGDLSTWAKRARCSSRNKKVLVIGEGNIGRRVLAKVGATFQVDSYDSAYPQGKELDALISKADLVTLHIPLSEDNRGFFGRDKLSLMKDGAVLVNTARGPIVDEEALFSELSSKRLRAAFDVFWQEPYRGKLAALHPDLFFMTPHVASTCQEFVEGLAVDFKQFVESFKL